jgi:hypothetical protein
VKLVILLGVGEGGVSDESEGWVREMEAGNGQMVPQFSGRSDYQYSALPHLSDSHTHSLTQLSLARYLLTLSLI